MAMSDRAIMAFHKHFDILTNSKSILKVIREVSKSERGDADIDSFVQR